MTGYYGVPAGFSPLTNAVGLDHDDDADLHADGREFQARKQPLGSSPPRARKTTIVRLDRGKGREAFELLLDLAGGDGVKLLVAIANHVSESDPIRYGIPDMLLRRVLLQVKLQADPKPAPLVPTRPRSVAGVHGLFSEKGSGDTPAEAPARPRVSSASSAATVVGSSRHGERHNRSMSAGREFPKSGRRTIDPKKLQGMPPRPLTPRMDPLARKPPLDNQPPPRLEAELSTASNGSGSGYRPLPLPGASSSSSPPRGPDQGEDNGGEDSRDGHARGEEEHGDGREHVPAGGSAGETDEDQGGRGGEGAGSNPVRTKKKKKVKKATTAKVGSKESGDVARDNAALEARRPSTALGQVVGGSSSPNPLRRLSGTGSSRPGRVASAGVSRGPGRESSGDRLGGGWNFSEVSIPVPQADWQDTMTVEEVERAVHLKKWLEHKKEVERQRQHAKWRKIQKDLKWLRDMRVAQNQRNRVLQESDHAEAPLSPKVPLSFDQPRTLKGAEDELAWLND
eukprot:jgi/Mesvir1/12923/Mv05941-RA.1